MIKLEKREFTPRTAVRWGIIIMLIVTPFAFIADHLFDLPQESATTNSIRSGFGEIKITSAQIDNLNKDFIYTDYDLGFQVVRPNENWEIHSISERMPSEKLDVLMTRGFIGGIYLEENHEKQFMISVVQIPDDDFDLDFFVRSQIAQLEMQTEVEVPIKQISLEKNWAIFAMKIPGENWNYGEQILFLKDGKLFMLQYSGPSPDRTSNEKKLEYLTIIDSFHAL